MDECANLGANSCDQKALCNNTEGSYTCRCLDGYQGDGKSCSGKYLHPSLISSLAALQAPVVQKMDSAIHRINHYPVRKY